MTVTDTTSKHHTRQVMTHKDQINLQSHIPSTPSVVPRSHVSASKAASSGLSADSAHIAPINDNSQAVDSLGGLPQHISD